MIDSRTLVRVMTLLVQTVRALFWSRADLALENLALRQQVAVLKQQRPRPPLTGMDRAFWVALQQNWKHWANALIIVQPGTVVKCTARASSSTGAGSRGEEVPVAHKPSTRFVT